MTLPLLIGHCGYSESLNLIASARLCFSKLRMFWYDGVPASPASTKKIIPGSAMDWSPFCSQIDEKVGKPVFFAIL